MQGKIHFMRSNNFVVFSFFEKCICGGETAMYANAPRSPSSDQDWSSIHYQSQVGSSNKISFTLIRCASPTPLVRCSVRFCAGYRTSIMSRGFVALLESVLKLVHAWLLVHFQNVHQSHGA